MDAVAALLHIPDSLRLNDAESIKGKMLQTGFLAQEVQKAAMELGYEFSGVDAPKNGNDLYGLRYSDFVVPLVKAVQQQQDSIEKQKKTLDEQQKINEKYKTAISVLEEKTITQQKEMKEANAILLEQILNMQKQIDEMKKK